MLKDLPLFFFIVGLVDMEATPAYITEAPPSQTLRGNALLGAFPPSGRAPTNAKRVFEEGGIKKSSQSRQGGK